LVKHSWQDALKTGTLPTNQNLSSNQSTDVGTWKFRTRFINVYWHMGALKLQLTRLKAAAKVIAQLPMDSELAKQKADEFIAARNHLVSAMNLLYNALYTDSAAVVEAKDHL